MVKLHELLLYGILLLPFLLLPFLLVSQESHNLVDQFFLGRNRDSISVLRTKPRIFLSRESLHFTRLSIAWSSFDTLVKLLIELTGPLPAGKDRPDDQSVGEHLLRFLPLRLPRSKIPERPTLLRSHGLLQRKFRHVSHCSSSRTQYALKGSGLLDAGGAFCTSCKRGFFSFLLNPSTAGFEFFFKSISTVFSDVFPGKIVK